MKEMKKLLTTRGQVFGKRADVIILGMVNQKTKETTLFLFLVTYLL